MIELIKENNFLFGQPSKLKEFELEMQKFSRIWILMGFKPFGKHLRNSPKLYVVMANTNMILDDVTCIKKYEVPIQVPIMTV
jgi:hypothetical protein